MDEGRRHGGWTMATVLKELGIERVFGLAGGHVMGFFDGCLTEGITVHDTRHEQAAVHMAEGWALATGEVGIAAVTAGPGLTNAATGVVNAQLGGSPVVLICGATATELDHREAVQQVEAEHLYGRIAKWLRKERDPKRLAASLKEAIHVARTGRPGVSVLQIPMDALMADAPEQETWEAPITRSAPDPADVERAVEVLASTDRATVLVGSGAHWSKAGDALREFTERTGIPVTTTSAARGLLPDDHPNCLGYLLHGGTAVAGADAVLLLGSKFNANLVYGGLPLFRPETKVIQVDVSPERLGGPKPVEVGIAGDVRLTLEALTEAWPGPKDRYDAWREGNKQLAEGSRLQWKQNWENAPASPVHPGRLAAEAVAAGVEAAGDEVTFVADGGDCLVWALAEFTALHPGCGLQTSTALGTLGLGLPYANAAAIATGRPVVAIFGDGAFGLMAMEIDTAVRNSLPVVTCISNNHAWGDVAHEHENWFGKGRVIAAELRDSDYAGLGRALGAYGERVESADDVKDAIGRAIATGGPAVVDVQTDPTVISELLRGLAEMGLM
jgi:acetolactate synthase-1/2/3 large subunit